MNIYGGLISTFLQVIVQVLYPDLSAQNDCGTSMLAYVSLLGGAIVHVQVLVWDGLLVVGCDC